MSGTMRTVGHGTLSAAAFRALLSGADIEVVVDVRRFPGSRRHPHFGSDALRGWLADGGLGYVWAPALGGRRTPDAQSPNTGLRNPQFQAYADHMATEEFRAGVTDVLARAAARRIALMCAESVWWRCHRRLVADHLTLVEGWSVEHLMHDGRLVAHPVTPGACRVGEAVVYGGALPGFELAGPAS